MKNSIKNTLSLSEQVSYAIKRGKGISIWADLEPYIHVLESIRTRDFSAYSDEGKTLINKLKNIARLILTAGPAAPTHIVPFLGLRSRIKFTGTGLAQPKTKTSYPKKRKVSNAPGNKTVPNKSTCFKGLSVRRPNCLAVGSPNR